MKKLLKLTALTLVAVLLLTSLVSCDASKGLKEAYMEAGYTVQVVSGESSEAKAFFNLVDLTEEEIDELEDYELILCWKSIVPAALIVKFPHFLALREFLIEEEDGVKDTSAYDKAKENGKINGNCLLIYGIGDADVIFASN